MANIKSSSVEDLMFVNISHPEDIRRQRAVQTKIRQHVVRRVYGHGRRQQTPRQRRTPIAAIATQKAADQGASDTAGEAVVMSPGRSLEPLGSFPIEGNMRILELVRFVNETPSFCSPFRRLWFKLALTDAGAFHVTLGNAAALSITFDPNEIVPETLEIMKHYHDGLMLLRKRLNSNSESSSLGTIANILAHVCLSYRNRDWVGWRVHMNGLDRIVDAHGGLNSLEHPVPIFLTQYDLSGAMAFDSFPLFPLPTILTKPETTIRRYPPRLERVLFQLNNIAVDISQARQALQKLSIIADVVNVSSHSESFWKNDIEAFSLIAPNIHFLLSIPRLPIDPHDSPHADDLVMKEMVRLICLIVMAGLSKMFNLFTTEKSALQAKFSDLLLFTRHWTGVHLQVKLWALVTAAILESGVARESYLNEISRALPFGLDQSVSNVVEEARDFIWIDPLESPSADMLNEYLIL